MQLDEVRAQNKVISMASFDYSPVCFVVELPSSYRDLIVPVCVDPVHRSP